MISINETSLNFSNSY